MSRRLRALVIAYYFPPMGLSGVQRTAKLVKYLPDEGVDVSVLTVRPGGYFAFDETLLSEVEREGVTIIRTPSADPTQLFGRERRVALPAEGTRRPLVAASQWLLQPDNKIGWLPFAMRAGRRLLSQVEHDVILASAPPYTGLLVGERLAGVTGLPFVADFRDDWVGNPRHTYPTRHHRRIALGQERRVVDVARRIHVVNEHIGQALENRHPGISSRVHIVPQGFDPQDFTQAQGSRSRDAELCTFLYTGVFYDAQRPDVFLEAFAKAVTRSADFSRHARARFVGLVPDSMESHVARLGLSVHVSTPGYLSHQETVREQQQADILWLTVGRRDGSEGISTGKLFEYLGARCPILGLVPEGTARQTLQASGVARCVDPDSIDDTADALLGMFADWKLGTAPTVQDEWLTSFDRQEQACRMADIFRTLTIT